MINPYVVKKWGALLMVGMITVIAFFAGFVMAGFTIALGAMALGLIISMVLANMMLSNPFSLMLEGKGVLFFDVTSTGIIRPFVMNVQPPYVRGMLDNDLKEDIFDREMVYNLTVPQRAGFIQQGEGKDGVVRTAIVIDEEEYNKGRFGFNHFPVVIWNSQLNTIVTKDWLSESEKTSFAEHQVLYLNRKVEELTTAMLNFGRYVVETTRPKNILFSKNIVIFIIIIALVILLILFAPAILPSIQQAMGGVTQAAGNAGNAVGAVQTVT